MLASMSVPMATAARPKSPAPTWRSASTSVASAWTTWVRSSAQAWTTLAEASTPRTSLPRRVSVLASERPKRPRPITRVWSSLANDRPFLGVAEQALALAQHQGDAGGDGADAPEEHQDHQYRLPRRVEGAGDAGREAGGREGRDALEEGARQPEVVARDQDQRREDHRVDGDHRDRERLAQGRGRDRAVEG